MEKQKHLLLLNNKLDKSIESNSSHNLLSQMWLDATGSLYSSGASDHFCR